MDIGPNQANVDLSTDRQKGQKVAYDGRVGAYFAPAPFIGFERLDYSWRYLVITITEFDCGSEQYVTAS